MNRAVFVGTQPATYEDEMSGPTVQKGNALHRIIGMMGITQDAFFQNFDYIHASPYYDPDGFSPEYYRVAIRNLRPLLRGRRVILLGPQVANSFDIERHQYEWCQFKDHPKWETFHGLFCVIPYPSAQNRFYDNPEGRGMVMNTLEMLWKLNQEENA